MKKFVAAAGIALLAASASVFAAVPSLSQVTQSIEQRDWQRADSQLSQVIAAHPDNPRAHYLYGQVLDREGRSADALAEIERAKSLDPSLHFTNPQAFAQTESRVRADAQRASGQHRSATSGGALVPTDSQLTQQAQFAPAKPAHHGPSAAMWIGLILLVAVIALVLRWTLRRSRSTENQAADDERRAQLKRATDLLNEVRPLKLDARISTMPGVSALTGEIEAVESEARSLVEALSNGKNPVPPYQLEDLEHRFASLKARVEGRPDPNAAPASAPGTNFGSGAGSGSVFAQEADRLTQPPYPPYPPQAPYPYPPQQPPVVIQQGGGIGSGVGGLLTGVLLGEALSGNRERVVERDVIVDDQRQHGSGSIGNPFDNGGNDSRFDLGQNDNWDSGNDSGGVDLGSTDDDWNNS
ncbi:tetratricopeptide repeat protein [Burkholderia sp. Ac-20379]|uniref:tetratricopeptide repeat protein n=1 Tax=Burkholderia sp. Ac-20379 TaxID=2703900 RepID=UPI00197D943E|nr:tetratricopeptide repeat protein [Burkholderia sp. Ac-20379]MBN3723196.1 tetratricopeptide repeat protein [Burkholderia sp. Ac-20379]